jgi:hypothetical protein
MRTPRRAGIAPIEFVLVWPLLLLLMAGIFLIARAGIAKAAVATEARFVCWEKRRTANATEPLVWDHNPRESEVTGHHKQRFASGVLFGANRFQAESHAFAMDKVWDYREQPFMRIMPMRVHESPFKQIAKNMPGGRGNVSVVAALAVILAKIVGK